MKIRELRIEDLNLLRTWLEQDDIRRFLGNPEEWFDEIAGNLNANWIKYFIVMAENPIAFLQYYETDMAPVGEWTTEPIGTVGIDFLIGEKEYLRKGYSSKLLGLLVEHIRSKKEYDYIIADPAKDNIASIKTLQNCGFKRKENGLYCLDIVHNGLKIFRAKETDVVEIAELFRDTVRNINSKDYSKAEIEEWSSKYVDYDRWKSKISEQYFLKATKGDQIVGFASLRRDGYLDYLFTHKDYQGKGVASSLIKQIERNAIAQDHTMLFSEVSVSAKSFFEKNGFKTIKQQNKRVRHKELINFVMEKALINKPE